jgi:thioester reductase-like protein
MAKHLFVTGGTGFIGGRLWKIWLERTQASVTLLVRRQGADSPGGRVARLLRGFPEEQKKDRAGRISLVEGDLTLPDLGLSAGQVADLAGSVTHMVHAAAALRFNLPLEVARQVNTGGTAAVLALARQCRRLESFQHVSTAYVAGCRDGVIREERGDGAVQHHNNYERSKFEAEDLVAAAMADIPACVLRPSIVTCALENGYAPPTSAFFRLLHGIATGALPALPGHPETPLDLVPVDYVVEAAFALALSSGVAGRFFHLSAGAENRITLQEVGRLISDGFGRKPVAILSPDDFATWAREACRAAPQLQPLLDEAQVYAPYLGSHPRFDDSNTRETLNGTPLPTRRFPDYCDRVVEYVRKSCGDQEAR